MSKSDRVILPEDVIPTHYSLELAPDLDPNRLDFSSNMEVNCKVVKEVSELTLHSKEISISQVSFKPASSDGKFFRAVYALKF